jgi:hypothetical protein
MTSLAQRLGFPTWAWVKGVHCGRKTRRAARPAERRFLRVPQQAAYQGEDAANPGAEGVGCRKETALRQAPSGAGAREFRKRLRSAKCGARDGTVSRRAGLRVSQVSQ